MHSAPRRVSCVPCVSGMRVYVVRTLNVKSTFLTSFEMHTTISLTTGTMLYNGSLESNHLTKLKLYTQYPHSSGLVATTVFSASTSLTISEIS